MMDFLTSRRDFLKNSSLSSFSLWTAPASKQTSENESLIDIKEFPVPSLNRSLDLAPAKWIWHPMQRCLPNTVVLFRKEFNLPVKPRSAKGYVIGDSRYQFFANGQRIQFGPAPADPRWAEADPVDLTNFLTNGLNVIGAQVLFYGHGDGTWPIGKPGFLFKLAIELTNGNTLQLISDGTWQTLVARSWKPGQYKRWYLRAFQEEFDARIYPHKWTTTEYVSFDDWSTAHELNNPANKPAVNSNFNEYSMDLGGRAETSQLRERSIPLLNESLIGISRLAESMTVRWKRSPYEYFEFGAPDSYEVNRIPCVVSSSTQSWTINVDKVRGSILTFEFKEQSVGFPYFTIQAPAGTVVELMVQEAHLLGGEPLLNTKFNSWTRFICRAGTHRFETFDYESLRWLQLHIHGTEGQAVISNVGMRRRQYPWPHPPQIQCSDSKIQKVLEACINTLHNSAQETIVDGMARERQQYSGDCGHQLHSIQNVFGDRLLHARFVDTYSQGITADGYFLDTWPAFDRLARIMERQTNLTPWGPLLDHSVGFGFDCWYYYLYTGDKTALTEVMPRLLKFFNYLVKLKGAAELLPVENIGVPVVWIDHDAYKKQRHKQCAFNLYAAAMLQRALAPLCEAFGMFESANKARAFGAAIQSNVVKTFWSSAKGVFVNNLPWKTEEKEERLCDRSLATAVLFDQCPKGITKFCAKALAAPPENMGLSYPANANWRYWALAKAGIVQPIIDDFRTRWYEIESVAENNTIAEWWHVRHDNGQQWSHCAVAPLFVTYMNLAGIQPLAPAFKKIQIRPQLGDLEQLSLINYTAQGSVLFSARGKLGNRTIEVTLPQNCEAELVVPVAEEIKNYLMTGQPANGLKRFRLAGGQTHKIVLKTV
ncbi:MAG: alpha-L-rhamnosidase N-terminal domain-containing protein [Spirosomataceae bacterium]